MIDRSGHSLHAMRFAPRDGRVPLSPDQAAVAGALVGVIEAVGLAVACIAAPSAAPWIFLGAGGVFFLLAGWMTLGAGRRAVRPRALVRALGRGTFVGSLGAGALLNTGVLAHMVWPRP
jgi:hypothetical protein